MRTISSLLIATFFLGSLLITGCAERRPAYGPYYGNSGYYGWNANEDAYYRQWLAERRYNYIEYNRLNRERQREYWEWKRRNEARFRNDPRFHQQQPRPYVRGDNDRDDRGNRNLYHDRDHYRASNRNGDHDRHQADRERHQVRNHHDRDRDHDHDRDRDHDRR